MLSKAQDEFFLPFQPPFKEEIFLSAAVKEMLSKNTKKKQTRKLLK